VKLDRLLSIIILLVNRRKVQAKELADLFEVSVRTIYRDIDVINQAGIPIVSYQGAGGGIGLSDGYRLDRSVLTNNELVEIVGALQSVSTIVPSRDSKLLLEKIRSIVPDADAEGFQLRTRRLIVDFSSWTRNAWVEKKILLLKQATEEERETAIVYCDAQGRETERTVEPYALVLKQMSWYLYAYCLTREEFRLFKLFRIKEIAVREKRFVRREAETELLPWNKEWTAPDKLAKLTLRFRRGVKHLAEEWFGVEALAAEPGENGQEERYLVRAEFPEDRWLYGFILSFGPEVEVVEPLSVRRQVERLAAEIGQIYSSSRGT
jgi:predicted DNA-binding transcriptional regulator YafY